MKKQQLVGTAFGALLACGFIAPAPAAFADQPSNDDQIYFAALEHEGLHPDYDKQICGSIKCASLRDLLVQEGHAVCSALDNSPRLVPLSVIANLTVSPEEAHAIINAARRAYCPHSPDPYTAVA